MHRFLLLSLVPIFAFAEVHCEMEQVHNDVGGDSSSGVVQYEVVCYFDGLEHNSTGVLSEVSCNELKSEVVALLQQARDSLYSAQTNVYQLSVYMDDLRDDVAGIYVLNGTQPPSSVTSEIDSKCADLNNGLIGTQAALQSASSRLSSQVGEVDNMMTRVEAIPCSNQSCSGSGSGGSSATCPCQTEFNLVLDDLDEVLALLRSIDRSAASNVAVTVQIKAQIDIMQNALSNIIQRLNVPDDRMWTELNEIYRVMSSNLYSVVYSTINFDALLHDLRILVQDGAGGNKLNLSTEGVISLYNSVFGMSRTLQDQYNYAAFDASVIYFSNTVSRLFQAFNEQFGLARNVTALTPENKYPHIYDSMTNVSLSARDRGVRLQLRTYGSVTNWFTRMELYQQAQLGWFEQQLPDTEQEENQSRVTESGLENSASETTNGLSTVGNQVAILTNSVNVLLQPFDSLSRGLVINPSLPTQLVIVPSLLINGHYSEPIVFTTTDFGEFFRLVRNCSKWLWHISFYVFLVVVVVFVGKLVFALGLYVLHVCQNL